MARRKASSEARIWTLLDQVSDPEIPVLSLWDLGVLRDIRREGDQLLIVITPTYSGCPALHTMQQDIEQVLRDARIENFCVRNELTPAWNSDDISPAGRAALSKYGIAPPLDASERNQAVACPRCDSSDTRLISEFGSTACKALYQCNQCLEPFDYFKCL